MSIETMETYNLYGCPLSGLIEVVTFNTTFLIEQSPNIIYISKQQPALARELVTGRPTLNGASQEASGPISNH